MKPPIVSENPAAARSRARFWRAVAAMMFLAVAGIGLVGAQDATEPAKEPEQASLGQVKNFAVPDYYDAPNQNQMKSLLRGAEAQPQPNGSVLIKDLQLETYTTNGQTVMIVRAPDCTYTYDAKNGQTATSSNRIEAASSDGKLFIEGEGFRWQQTNSVFVISNKVHTLIRQAPETTAAP